MTISATIANNSADVRRALDPPPPTRASRCAVRYDVAGVRGSPAAACTTRDHDDPRRHHRQQLGGLCAAPSTRRLPRASRCAGLTRALRACAAEGRRGVQHWHYDDPWRHHCQQLGGFVRRAPTRRPPRAAALRGPDTSVAGVRGRGAAWTTWHMTISGATIANNSADVRRAPTRRHPTRGRVARA